MDPAHLLLERIRAGRSTIVVGEMPPLPEGVAALRVACDEPGTAGPLERARRAIADVLERSATVRRDDRARAALRKLLHDEAWRAAPQSFLEACNMLAAKAPGRIALVLDGIDHADGETHRALAEIFHHPAVLALPLVLVCHDEPGGTFREVVAALGEGDAARSARQGASAPVAPGRAGAVVEAESPETPRLQPRPRQSPPLPDDVLRALRGAALIGPRFEAEVLARLLEVPLDHVLECLQRARDVGVPVVDRGDGKFVLPEELTRELVDSVLPSLRKRWQERLGELYAAARPPATRDPLRAAAAFEAAGRRERALEQRLDAAARMIDAGELTRARAVIEDAGLAIAAMPKVGSRVMLEARLAVERARLGWLGAGNVAPASTLAKAFDEVLAARAQIARELPTPLRAYIAATLAAIAYELGDARSIGRAREELEDSIAVLLELGATLDAASLLNEQAALELRGMREDGREDAIVRARELLGRSKALFEARLIEAPGDGAARAELADTDHLLARLPLHGDGAAGVDLSPALESARKAERSYQVLGMRRELARVWDTLGRLEMRRGRTDAARTYSEAALRTAEELGDAAGVARASAALAELLAAIGRPEQAVDLLRTSIGANREKGSPAGLAFDAAALATVERAVARMGGAVEASVKDDLVRMRASLTSSL